MTRPQLTPKMREALVNSDAVESGQIYCDARTGNALVRRGLAVREERREWVNGYGEIVAPAFGLRRKSMPIFLLTERGYQERRADPRVAEHGIGIGEA